MQSRKVRLLAVAATSLALLVASASIATAVVRHLAGGHPVNPAAISALGSNQTALTTKTSIHGLGPDYAPDPGTVPHSLGDGLAIGWRHGNRVCASSEHYGEWASGCIDPSTQVIDFTISQPGSDAPGGADPEVFGVAVDGVTTVTVLLADGSGYSAASHQNWYDVHLPVGTAISGVVSLRTKLADGTSTSLPVSFAPTPATP
jgi:hypothetical protein